MLAVNDDPSLRQQVNQLIITLRKAAAQQKQLEESCQFSSLEVDYRWSLNHLSNGQVATSD
jgi:hypothetical protein